MVKSKLKENNIIKMEIGMFLCVGGGGDVNKNNNIITNYKFDKIFSFSITCTHYFFNYNIFICKIHPCVDFVVIFIQLFLCLCLLKIYILEMRVFVLLVFFLNNIFESLFFLVEAICYLGYLVGDNFVCVCVCVDILFCYLLHNIIINWIKSLLEMANITDNFFCMFNYLSYLI